MAVGDMKNTQIDKTGSYPAVLPDLPASARLRGDSSSALMGQDLNFSGRDYGEAERTMVGRLPAGTLKSLGLRQ